MARLQLILIVTVVLSSLLAHSDVVGNPTLQGPYRVATGQYRFQARIDNEVLPKVATELWARVFWPKSLPHQLPLIFLLHGNHSTCDKIYADGTRVAGSCQYTMTGTCDAGETPTPSHEGFNYAAAHLASYGYIVVSINANRGLNCNGGNADDFGLNLARGRLVLRHLEAWRRWSIRGGAPGSLKVKSSSFINKIDFTNVGLMGHSRGGEAMRAAYALYNDSQSQWSKRNPNVGIRGIFEIGATDGQTARILDADGTAWNQLLPMCDGDVTDLEGRMPFERMMKHQTETPRTPKSLYMVWGANHNFFNSIWQSSDSSYCSGHSPIFGQGPISPEQQQIARTAMTSFFLTHVGLKRAANLRAVFNPAYALPSFADGVTRIDRDYLLTADQNAGVRLDDFELSSGKSAFGVANSSHGIRVFNETNGYPSRANISWDEKTTHRFLQLNWTEKGKAYAIDQLGTLNFRLSRQSSFSGSKVATSFKIALVDAEDHLSNAVSLNRYLNFLGPASDVTVYQTVRIPVSDFQIQPGAGVRGVRFVFDESPVGAMYLANVRFTIPDNQLFFSHASNEVKTNTSLELAPKLVTNTTLQSAEIVGVERQRKFQGQQPVVEISVHSRTGFPVQDSLPTLVIGGKQFQQSRYLNMSDLQTLIFSLPLQDYLQLPNSTSIWVQYGPAQLSHVWLIDKFNKSSWSL